MADKRNYGKHTEEGVIIYRILAALEKCKDVGAMPKSGMGRVAYPDYNFRAPQGAAFSVAKVTAKMMEQKLIWPESGSGHGYVITRQGEERLKELKGLFDSEGKSPEGELACK